MDAFPDGGYTSFRDAIGTMLGTEEVLGKQHWEHN